MPHWPGDDWFHSLKERLNQVKGDPDALLLVVELSCRAGGEPRPLPVHCLEAVRELEEFSHPVVGLVDGDCFDCCMEIAAACDLLYATEGSIFGFPTGILPGLGGTQRITRIVGLPKAKELYLAGRLWNARQAFQNGLLTGLGGNLAQVQEVSRELVSTVLTRSPLALSLCKEVVHRGYDLDLRNGCEFERQVFSLCFTSHDQKEGMRAFAEKRRPAFKGLE